jgi:hypothetical protein
MGLPDRRALVIVYAVALILTIEQWLHRIVAQLGKVVDLLTTQRSPLDRPSE